MSYFGPRHSHAGKAAADTKRDKRFRKLNSTGSSPFASAKVKSFTWASEPPLKDEQTKQISPPMGYTPKRAKGIKSRFSKG